MKVLVVGSGGREHALCWKLKSSPLVTQLFCAPGNAGIENVATCVAIAADKVDELVAFAKREGIGFVVVGPEVPLVLGLVDQLTAAGIPAFGPSAAAAELEGSKVFMKDIVAKYGVPTAAYRSFTDRAAAGTYLEQHIQQFGLPVVIKASGLAAGKGVLICETKEDAVAGLDQIMVDRVFDDAGSEVVIEEFMQGEEASFFALVDGTTAIPLVAAQDHKRVGDGDTGPNTGGMGAYSPAPVVTEAVAQKIMEQIVLPTVRGMAAEGKPYRGVLFAGLMIKDGQPKLIEFNVRFGDPECQVLMARLESDLLPALMAAAKGDLSSVELKWSDRSALVVVMAAQGYPGSYLKNTEIKNLDVAAKVPDVVVLHAGTARNTDGKIVATGGRVLGVTAIGSTVKAAREAAYAAVDSIIWPEGFCRRDIAWRALER